MSAAPSSHNQHQDPFSVFERLFIMLESATEIGVSMVRAFPGSKSFVAEKLEKVIRMALKAHLEITGQSLDLSKLQPTVEPASKCEV